MPQARVLQIPLISKSLNCVYLLMTLCISRCNNRGDTDGLGLEKPDNLKLSDDEYEAYRKRMMLAYRFRPNPLVMLLNTSIVLN